MGDRDRLLGRVDDVQGRPLADVGQVDEDAEAVHLGYRVGPEVSEPSGDALVAAVAQQVALVVRDLDDPDAESVEDGEPVYAVLDGRRVLEAEYDARLTVALGREDVVDRPDRGDRVGALPEPDVPPRQVVDRLPEPLPGRDGGVDGRDPAGPQALVDRVAVPVTDVQPVHDDWRRGRAEPSSLRGSPGREGHGLARRRAITTTASLPPSALGRGRSGACCRLPELAVSMRAIERDAQIRFGKRHPTVRSSIALSRPYVSAAAWSNGTTRMFGHKRFLNQLEEMSPDGCSYGRRRSTRLQ